LAQVLSFIPGFISTPMVPFYRELAHGKPYLLTLPNRYGKNSRGAIIGYFVSVAHVAGVILSRGPGARCEELKLTAGTFLCIFEVRINNTISIDILKIDHRDFVSSAWRAGQFAMSGHRRIRRAMDIMACRTTLRRVGGAVPVGIPVLCVSAIASSPQMAQVFIADITAAVKMVIIAEKGLKGILQEAARTVCIP
jgi:hypothetical protein